MWVHEQNPEARETRGFNFDILDIGQACNDEGKPVQKLSLIIKSGSGDISVKEFDAVESLEFIDAYIKVYAKIFKAQ